MNNTVDKDSIYYAFIGSLIEKIKARYKGGVNARIVQNETDDYCEIKIIRIKDLGFIFTYKIYDISTKLINNYTSDNAIDELDKAYKKFAIDLAMNNIYAKEYIDNERVFKSILSRTPRHNTSKGKDI